MKNTILLPFALLAAAACQSTEPQVTLKDANGNYVTTADFNAMQRTDFVRAIQAGLEDYDEQMAELRSRANELGGDSLEEFAECEGKLREKRIEVVNQLAIAENALDGDWPDAREETVEEYVELREAFTEAQEDVFDA